MLRTVRAESAVDPLPGNAVLLHIGTHKTGTTALQAILAAARPVLAEHGICYPGRSENHHRAARAIRRLAPRGRSAPPPEAWTQFAAEVAAQTGRVVISSEFFSSLDEAGRERLIRDLGPDRLHVVLALRHPARRAPSWWQQTLKEGRSLDFDGWLERTWGRSGDPIEQFDETVVRQWSASVGSSNMTVIVIDDDDPRLLPATFEQLLALEPGTLADRTPRITNRSMTAQEAEFVRQVNASLRGKVDETQYDALVRNGLIRRLVEVRTPPPDEAKVRLPQWAADISATLGAQSAAAIEASGARVVGDIEYFRTPLAQPAPLDPAQQQVVPVSAAVEAAVGLVGAATKGTWDIEGTRRAIAPEPEGRFLRAKLLLRRAWARVRHGR